MTTLKIGVLLPGRLEDAGEYLADARALDAAGVDSLWVDEGSHDPWMVLAAVAAVTGQARLVAPRTPSTGEGDARRDTLEQLSRGRITDAPAEGWARRPFPDGPEAWRETLRECEAAGMVGLLVPTDPRLLDLLRNGDREEDRSDLTLAQG